MLTDDDRRLLTDAADTLEDADQAIRDATALGCEPMTMARAIRAIVDRPAPTPAPAPGLDLEAIERDITDDQLVRWASIARAASNDPLEWGPSAVDGAAFMLDAYGKGPPGPVHTVWFGTSNDAEIVAITGNGPTSEANAKHIAWSSPRNVTALIAEARALRARLAESTAAAVGLAAEADRLRAEVARLTAEADETHQILEESVADWERRVACAGNICAHCKEPHTSEGMSAHVAACPRNPLVARLAEAKRLGLEAVTVGRRRVGGIGADDRLADLAAALEAL